ncbi:MAG: hypothetical protein K1X35_10355 [Caulobacteraceae bacterium]|nr:hypothetical protein [Caulobacteraceae bacterium]
MRRSIGQLFTSPVTWREPVGLYTFVGWLAAVSWPAIVGTLIFFPPTAEAGGLLNDWRLKALIAGGLAVAAIIWLVKGEREREGGPSSRLGILARFLLFGFIFSLAALILVVLGFAIVSAFGNEGFLPALGGIESTLFLFGVAGLPFALMVGISYALWSGLMVSLIVFSPPPPTVPRARVSALFGGALGRPEPDSAEMDLAANPEPEPEPAPPPPEPKVDLEGGVSHHPEREEH